MNFDLLILPQTDTYHVRVVDSPVGQATGSFTLPFTQAELDQFAWQPGVGYRHLRPVEATDEEKKLLDPQKFGTRLFTAVFAGQVSECLRRSLDAARREKDYLRVRLRLTEVPELAMLPWEYLYDPVRDQFFALLDQVALMRYMESPEPEEPLQTALPLRILVMVSKPQNAQPLAVEQEWERLQQSLQPLIDQSKVVLDKLASATYSALQGQLRRNEYHIFHFIGHGWFDEKTEASGLLFEDEQGNGSLVPATVLKTVLQQQTLRLMFLNACEGARAISKASFGGTAQQLVQQGLSAVLAMQFPITDKAALRLAQEFYQALADGYPVDRAVTEARKAIYGVGNEREWATPVLFMRALSERLFNIDFRQHQFWPPAKIDRFVGRTTELDELTTKLNSTSVAVIVGMPGIGKTSLAAKLADQFIKNPRFIFYQNLHQVHDINQTIAMLVDFLAMHGDEFLYKRKESGGISISEDFYGYLFNRLQGKGFLLWFDGFERVDQDPGYMQLTQRFQTAANAGAFRLIVTSQRQPAFVIRNDFTKLERFDSTDVKHFFLQKGILLSDELARKVDKITEDIPFFLFLLADLVEQEKYKLEANMDELIAALVNETDPKNKIIERFDQQLSSAEKCVMNALAILQGGSGSKKVIETILHGKGIATVEKDIENLAERHILERIGDTHYRLHSILCVHYDKDIGSSNDRQIMHLQAARYFKSVRAERWQAVYQYDKALEHAVDSNIDIAIESVEFAAHDTRALLNNGNSQELRTLLDRISAEHHEQLEQELLTTLYIVRGEVYRRSGDVQKATNIFEATKRMVDHLPSSNKANVLKVRAYRRCGEQYKFNKDPGKSLSCFEQALTILSEHEVFKDPSEMISQTIMLEILMGWSYVDLGDYSTAQQMLENVGQKIESLGGVVQELELKGLEVDALTNLGAMLMRQSKFSEARYHVEQALNLAIDLKDKFRETSILINLALILHKAGDWPGAIKTYKQALEEVERLNMPTRQIVILLNLSILYMYQACYEKAENLLQESIYLAQKKYKLNALAVGPYCELSSLYILQDKADPAMEKLEIAIQLAKETNRVHQKPSIYRNIALAKLAKGDLVGSHEAIEMSLKIARQPGAGNSNVEHGASLRVLADINLIQGALVSQVLPLYQQSHELLREDMYEAARTEARWGEVLLNTDERDGGVQKLTNAYAIFIKLDAQHDINLWLPLIKRIERGCIPRKTALP